MPLNASNQRTFHRRLFSEQIRPVTLLKRGPDQQQGTVRAIKLWEAWPSSISKQGEPLQGDMTTEHTITWHFARIELDRVGVAYLSALDRVVDHEGRTWQPESDDLIEVKLFQVHVHMRCKRADPPASGA